MNCAFCDEKKCYGGRDCTGRAEEFAPILSAACDHEVLKAAAAVEADHYMRMTRVEETLAFAANLGVTHIGVAFCLGLAAEARLFCELAASRGLKVDSVCCKVCGIDKGELGLKKLWGREHEATCNPVAQADVLNRKKTGLNVAIGLCVGHDALFFKYSQAPATTLIAKDRVLAHNPAGALYSGYYARKLAAGPEQVDAGQEEKA